jgi:hypothetical protein
MTDSGSRSNRSQGEEKGDWLAALHEQSAPRIPRAGRVPVPLFRPAVDHQDLLFLKQRFLTPFPERSADLAI